MPMPAYAKTGELPHLQLPYYLFIIFIYLHTRVHNDGPHHVPRFYPPAPYRDLALDTDTPALSMPRKRVSSSTKAKKWARQL